ncbi:hypothetical protein DUI87_29835 [Hirundo rustica rustica]|uniref:Uncharacterized protein n=1 Tax=Hirundo rustica rustica TaxID=333673 RepID=A0A3M0J459_HIRRU|nr:hypothetical protein DUI87_29835 [Hirundo rustica rustica]
MLFCSFGHLPNFDIVFPGFENERIISTSLIYLLVVSVLLISLILGDMGIYMMDFDSHPHRALATIHESVVEVELWPLLSFSNVQGQLNSFEFSKLA